MSRLTHAELADARDKKHWPLLWQQALPLVGMVVRRLAGGASNKENVDAADLQQQGAMIAGLAIRAWRPIECAFSTYVANQVRWSLLKYMGKTRNHGIGSYEQCPVVLDLSAARDSSSAGVSGDDDADEEGLNLDAALTYEGVIRRDTGQFDGLGTAPEGYGDPAYEADRIRHEEAIERVITEKLTKQEQIIVRRVHGFDGPPTSTRELAAEMSISLRTVERYLKNARNLLAENLSNSKNN